MSPAWYFIDILQYFVRKLGTLRDVLADGIRIATGCAIGVGVPK